MFDNLESATPEQVLITLIAELKTPIEIIIGFAHIIRNDIESNNINSVKVLEAINTIAEKADWIKELCDEIVRSQIRRRDNGESQ